MKKLILTLALFIAGLSFVQAQVYTMTNNGSVTDCSGTFLDPGGVAGGYANNSNVVYTICPDLTTGTHVQLLFGGVDIALGDDMIFYDGTSTSDPLIFSLTTDLDPGVTAFIAQSTVENQDGGCLTIEFISDGSGVGAGWGAEISCVPACQLMTSAIISSVPAIEPVDTGWLDVCVGQRIFLSGDAIYLQNDIVYHQSDSTTIFEWAYGDGDISYGLSASHVYNTPGGYILELQLEDQFGCENTNYIRQRVRVSPAAEFNFGPTPPPICAGDTVALSCFVNQVDSTFNLSVLADTAFFEVGDQRADSLALPDGTGIIFQSVLTTTQFSPGQTLTDVSQLQGFCLNMEHSWMHDIEIWMECPNGQSVILQNQVFEGFCNLGEPIDGDLAFPTGGVGYEYCWTPTATNGNWSEELLAGNTIVVGGLPTMPAGNYSPFDDFSGLIGCPLNGDWTLNVFDNWGSDNGFVYSWGVSFADYLYPAAESFSPQFIDFAWNNNSSIISYANDSTSITASPNAGDAQYTFTVTNDFGCTYDTTVTVSILPATHPDCYDCQGQLEDISDTIACGASPVMLEANYTGPGNGPLTFEALLDYSFGAANHPHNNPFNSVLNVNSMYPGFLTSPATQIASVCIDITTDSDSDITVKLKAPNNTIVELTSGNGGLGDNFTNTCFTPTATQTIQSGLPPFTGEFIPEGLWSTFNNAPINGAWKLLVSDGFGPTKKGVLNSWSITFLSEDDLTYEWTPATGLSCDDCPNPIVSEDGTYTVNVTNSYGCEYTDQVNVLLLDSLPEIPLTCFPTSSGDLVVNWTPVAGITDYLVSVNNGPWQLNTVPGSITLTGLPNPASANIQVQPQTGAACFAPVSSISCFVVNCELYIQLSDTIPVSCFGENDGAVFISAFQGFTPITYNLDGGAYQSSTAFFDQSASQHIVVAKDAYGCLDTLTVNIPGPPPISISTLQTDVSCFNGDDATATASALGGTNVFTYKWNTVPITNAATAINLEANAYTVTVTDNSGCSKSTVVSINQPLLLNLVLSDINVSCFGNQNGSATVNVSNGVQPYTYLWSNGGTATNISNLVADTYTVTVTDANGCTASAGVAVTEPLALEITVITLPTQCAGTASGSASAFVLGGVEPYSYDWSAGIQLGNNAVNLLNGAINVIVTDASGCTILGTAVVASPPPLSADVIDILPTSCFNTTDGSATAIVNGGNWPYLFIWNNGDNDSLNTTLPAGNNRVIIQDAVGCRDTILFQNTSPAAIVINLLPSATLCALSADGGIVSTVNGGVGVYQYNWSDASSLADLELAPAGNYTVTVTDAEGCTTSKTSSIAAPALLIIDDIVATKVSCFGGSDAQLTALVSGGVGSYSYDWSDDNVPNTNPGLGFAAGAYTVTVTDLNLCTVTSVFTILQPTELVLNGFSNSAKCNGSNDGIATVSASGGTYPYSFEWQNGDLDSIATNLVAGSYNVVVTDAKGCTNNFTISVVEPINPLAVSTTQTETGCFGQNDGAVEATVQGGTGTYTYFWSNLSTTAAISNLYPINYTVTVTDINNCKATSVINVLQHDSIDIDVIYTSPTCFNGTDGQVQILTVTGGGGSSLISGYTYNWSTTPIQTSFLATNLNALNSYQFQVTALTTGCAKLTSFLLNNPEDIVISPNVVNNLCYGDNDASITLTVASINPVVNYNWSAAAQTGNVATAQNLIVGVYAVTVVDNLGCTKLSVIPVTEPALLQVDDTNQTNVTCASSNDGAVSVIMAGGVPAYAFQWAKGDTTNYLFELEAGTYTFQVTDVNGCVLIDSIIITTPEPLIALPIVTDVTCFNGVNGSIDLLLTGGAAPFQASIDGFNYVGTDELIGLEANTYQLSILDANGCTFNVPATVGQPQTFSIDIGLDTTINFGQSITLNAMPTNAQGGSITYNWTSPLDYILDCYDCPIVEATPYYTTVLSVVATDALGCMAEDQINIEVGTARYADVATGFSPNGDANNNLLIVQGKTGTQVLRFRIFDRWGNVVYEDAGFLVNDPNRGWDGTYKGQPLDMGVFSWTLDVSYRDGKLGSYEGHANLIR